ncbi:MAG TPA: voltage-gated chloride channel family protein [Limnobacter sp.]|uniref:voltage-gated chloride channel family protein n=1 Tax=Limnobacter sp. TaxID=2003368 RepID=UPI002EDAC9F5
MPIHPRLSDRLERTANTARWIALASLVAVLAGSASAWFLIALDWVGQTRTTHPQLVLGLPLAGLVVGWVYLRFGQQVEAGNNLLIDEIHDPKKTIPLRMAPLVLGGTLISHLFGASVGREGTAVQMGGALADQLTHLFRLKPEDRRILLMSGVSAGFASVFGTPVAGAIWGLEVLTTGKLKYDALLPCTVAAVVAHEVCLLWGVEHTHYVVASIPAISLWGLCAVALAGAAFGLGGKLFAETTHALAGFMKQRIAYAPLRPFLGGCLLAALFWSFPLDRYQGLGIPVILESFEHPLAITDFIGKLSLTVLSLGSGFKGGEVTPLFFLGATLGNALAPLLHMPFALMAGVGFVALFAGASNTPIACTIMAMELFGSGMGVYAGLACVMSYLFSGHSSIYKAQRRGLPK